MDSKWFKLAKDSLPPEIQNLERALNAAKMKNIESYKKDRRNLMIQAPYLPAEQWSQEALKIRNKYKDVLSDDELHKINLGL